MSKRKRNPFFERLKEGLEEGIAYAKGEDMDLKTTEVALPPPAPKFSPRQVRELRERLEMTSEAFARALNVSNHTLSMWEKGKARPSSPALRLLQILEKEPEMVSRVVCE